MNNYTDIDIYFRFIVALGLVILLIGAIAWFARFFGFSSPLKRGAKIRRLGIIDSIAIDAKRRLILVSRDDMEHLLCVGGETDLVIEQSIKSVVPLSEQKIIANMKKIDEDKQAS